MKPSLLLLLLLSFYHPSIAVHSEKFLALFPEDILEKANTARDFPGLNAEEKETVLWTNLIRMAPATFARVVDLYIAASKDYTAANPYVLSLKKDLLKATPVKEPLTVASLHNELARQHALYSQKTKRYGHDQAAKRAATIQKQSGHQLYSENCSYHRNNALDFIMDLMIDENVKGTGHRKTILNPQLEYIGVAITPFISNKECVLVQVFSAEKM